MTGYRKVAFGFLGLSVLLLGYSLTLAWPAGAVAFPAFATAVVSVVVSVTVGNVGEHLAKKGQP